MTRRAIHPYAERLRRAELRLEPMAIIVPDRSAGAFGEGRRVRIATPGRPSCLYANTIVSVNRVRAGEGSR